jgi:hypothetical protein
MSGVRATAAISLHCRELALWATSANRTAQQFSSFLAYSITSSAMASSVGGTVRPSALAVLRLMIVSYLVGC